MPLMGHLRELRNVLIKCAIALADYDAALSVIFTTQILQFLIAPYGGILETIDPTENVTTYFRVALVSGAVLAMPFLIYFIWSFIAPGLEAKEKRYVRYVVPGATFLFLLGVAFAWGIDAARRDRFPVDLRTDDLQDQLARGGLHSLRHVAALLDRRGL